LHPFAESAAESAEYAAEQGRFWEMHDALYENQETLDPMSILSIGAQLGLSHTELRKALETGRYREKVQSDYMSGVRSGVNGTPTFFINGVRHDGSYDFASLASAIQPHVEASTNA
jgi:protein-disulfide isomerase